MVQIKYFGAIAEQTNATEEIIEYTSPNLAEVVRRIAEKYKLHSSDYQVAVNAVMISNLDTYKLNINDVIALLPPFAGG